MSIRTRKKSGFARTKNYPHKRHPATYNRIGNDEIEYITFTHHNPAKINDKTYNTLPLSTNIDVSERGKSKSYAFPKVFVGKRSALGKEDKNLSLTKEDKKFVDSLFKTLPKEKVPYSTNSKKKKWK